VKAEDEGTHLWHAHSNLQRGDGIFGAFVVRSSTNNSNYKIYDYDLSEHVIVVNDWTHEMISSKYNKFKYSHGDERIDSILVNGKAGDQSNNLPIEKFFVQSGKSYRFR
jgi:L-ascorbate oxidase